MDLRLPPEFEHLVPKKCETPGRAPRRIRYARADGEAEGAPPVPASAEGAPVTLTLTTTPTPTLTLTLTLALALTLTRLERICTARQLLAYAAWVRVRVRP